MEEVNEPLLIIGAIIFGLFAVIFSLLSLLALLALPFFAVGIGLSFIAWAVCPFLSFC